MACLYLCSAELYQALRCRIYTELIMTCSQRETPTLQNHSRRPVRTPTATPDINTCDHGPPSGLPPPFYIRARCLSLRGLRGLPLNLLQFLPSVLRARSKYLGTSGSHARTASGPGDHPVLTSSLPMTYMGSLSDAVKNTMTAVHFPGLYACHSAWLGTFSRTWSTGSRCQGFCAAIGAGSLRMLCGH